MFQNHTEKSVGFESSWKLEKSSEECSTQTSDVSTKDAQAQAATSQEAGIQTDTLLAGAAAKLESDAEERLAAFLRRIEPQVLRELDRAARSHDQLRAVEESNVEEDLEPVKCCHTLHASAQVLVKGLQQVSCLSWSPTGAVIAVGHSWPTHETWCSHDSEIHLYNTNMQDFDPEKPSKVLSSPSCITALKHHQNVASLLAAGTYSGEVLVWGVSSDTPVRAGAAEGHGEAVTSVLWMNPGPQRQQQTSLLQPQALLSAGLDGRLLAWRLESASGPLSQQHSFSIGCQHLPEKQRSANPDDLQPITSMSLIGQGAHPSCLVGTQAGCVLLCDLRDPSKDDPVVRSFKGHLGAVTSISAHLSWTQMFATCGDDHEIHIYNMKQESAVRVLHCSRKCIGVTWGVANTLAWWGGGSEVEILTLQGEDMAPTQLATLEPNTEIASSGHTTALCFNPFIYKVLKCPSESRPGEVDIAIAANCWIINDTDIWWPRNKPDARNMAKRCTNPTEKMFYKSTYTDVLFETNDFSEALAEEKRKVEESSSGTSTDGETKQGKKRKRSRNPKYDSDIYEKSDTGRRTKDTTRKGTISEEGSDSSSDDDGIEQLSDEDDRETSFNRSISAVQSTPKSTKSTTSSSNGNGAREVDNLNKSDAVASPVTSKSSSSAVLKKILELLTENITAQKATQLDVKFLSKALKDQDEKIDRLIAIGIKENPTVNPYVGRKYKLQTEEELQELEDSLKDEENLKLLTQRLVLLGDKTEKDLIRNSLKFLLHKDLASQYTAQGRRGEKKKFVSLQIFQAIAGAVRSVVPGATDKSIQSLVGINLTQSIDWDQGRLNRSANKTANKTADSSADKDDMEMDAVNINPQPQSKKRKD